MSRQEQLEAWAEPVAEDRLQLFSDAVFAISTTLLVLDIHHRIFGFIARVDTPIALYRPRLALGIWLLLLAAVVVVRLFRRVRADPARGWVRSPEFARPVPEVGSSCHERVPGRHRRRPGPRGGAADLSDGPARL